MIKRIGIIGGAGHYGRLLRRLIRRFTDDVEVLANDIAVPPDGRSFVELEGLKDCDATIISVPMAVFEETVKQLLAVEGLREDMILVNVCSDQTKSGAALAALAGNHPHISGHSPWGPEAYRMLNEMVNLLPPIVITQVKLPHPLDEDLFCFLQNCGFKIERNMSAEEHDRNLAGRWMFTAHLFTQILHRMGLLEIDCRAAPVSFQNMVEAALLLRNDKKLFFDLWARVPECHMTFDAFLTAANGLSGEMHQHINGK